MTGSVAKTFSIPEGVQSNAKNGLELHKKYGRGGTSVGLASARTLSGGGEVSEEFVRKVAKYFPRHANDNLDDKTSNGWISWQLWGGTAGKSWSESKVKEMEKIFKGVFFPSLDKTEEEDVD